MTRFPLPLAALCLIVATRVAVAQNEETPSPQDMPHITVVGTASKNVVPDLATIRLGVTIEKSTAAEAWSTDSSLAKGIVDAAKVAGIKPEDIATASVTLFEQIENVRQSDGTFKPVRRGFRATQDLLIRTTALDRIGTLTQRLIDKGANTFQGVSFSLADARSSRAKLSGEALKDARLQAEALAAAGGVKLGRLLQVERPEPSNASSPVMRHMMVKQATMPIEPGTETLSEQVEAVYAIE